MPTFPKNSIGQRLANASASLKESPTPDLDAEVLLAFCLAKNRSNLRAWPEKLLPKGILNQFDQLVNLRAKGTPIAYLVSEKEFWSRSFIVSPDVLIPRPETELLVEIALTLIPTDQKQDISDLGTGSGAIAITLGLERPTCEVMAIDFSLAALVIAKQNSTALGARNITFVESNWLTETSGKKFDLIVSNPPYIDNNDHHLQQGDVRFEPSCALIAGNNGFSDFESIITQARLSLKEGGHLLFEHGFEQHKKVHALLNANHFEAVSTYKDLLGHPRVTKAQWNG